MHLIRRIAVLASTAALLPAATAAAADRYLATSSPGPSAGCLDEPAPCTDLDVALDASSAGDVIHLAAGTYTAEHLGSREVDVPVTLEGPRAGVPAPGRTGSEAVISAYAFGLNLTAPGAAVDGLTIAEGAPTGIAFALGTSVRNTIIRGSADGLGTNTLGSGATTVEGNAITADRGLLVSGGDFTVADNLMITTEEGIRVQGATTAATITGNDLRGPLGIGVTGSAAPPEIHGNRIVGTRGVIAIGSGLAVDATDNWWGCNEGPAGGTGCAEARGSGGATVDADPWLVLDTSAPATVVSGQVAPLQAFASRNSDGDATSWGDWRLARIIFDADDGFISPSNVSLADGIAETEFFSPSAGGSVSWTATLDNETVVRTITVTSDASASPSTLAYGDVLVGTTETRTITITNTGPGPIEIQGVGSSAGPGFSISRDACFGRNLARFASCQIDLSFSPSGPGASTAEVTVSTSGGGARASATGRGVTAPVATVSPRALQFGDQVVGTTSAPQTVTVENTGGSRLDIVRLSGKDAGQSLFAVTDDGCTGASLDPEETCTFDVAFTPTAVGSWQPRIEVLSNAAKQTVRVRGDGVKPLGVSPASWDFGAVQRRTSSAPRTFVVTNRTDAPQAVALSKSGTGRTLFALDPGTCDDGPVAAGATCSFTVTFAPQAVGSWSPSVEATGGGRTTSVPISGQGVA